jgi:hypothetical protein
MWKFNGPVNNYMKNLHVVDLHAHNTNKKELQTILVMTVFFCFAYLNQVCRRCLDTIPSPI